MPRTLGLLGLLSTLVLPCVAVACSQPAESAEDSESALRGLTQEEALAEFDQVANAVRNFYGPLEYKKQKLGLDFEAAVAEGREEVLASETEADLVRPVFKLLAKLRDGHVSYSYPLQSQESFRAKLPIFLTPVEGKYVVHSTSEEGIGAERGDVVVSIDGKTTQELESLLRQVIGEGTPDGERHEIGYRMTTRPFYVPNELKPAAGATAHLVLTHADGTEYTLDIPWKFDRGLAGLVAPPRPAVTEAIPSNDVSFSTGVAEVLQHGARASLDEYGEPTPFFMTEQVRAALGVVEVSPKAATLESVGVTIPAEPSLAQRAISLRAYKYKHQGKTILLVRIPAFTTAMNNYDAQVAWLSALVKDNNAAATSGLSLAETPADTIVVDVTHNPGGLVPYVGGLARIFSPTPFPNFVQACRADRRWIAQFLAQTNSGDANTQPIYKAKLDAQEAAYDAGKWLGPFVPLGGVIQGPTLPKTPEQTAGSTMLSPYPGAHWSKPVLVLTDELSVSGGDAFPMLLQNAKIAKTFGHATGGLGGSVEQVATLPHSAAQLNLTRGLFAAWRATGAPKPVENVGVQPDYPYEHTIADFRAGYVGYAKAFSDVAARSVRAQQ